MLQLSAIAGEIWLIQNMATSVAVDSGCIHSRLAFDTCRASKYRTVLCIRVPSLCTFFVGYVPV